MKDRYHVVIVGSGIGGLSAAHTLSGHGLDILIIDENFHSGGQLLRKPETSSRRSFKFNPDAMKAIGFSLVQKIKTAGPVIDQVNGAQVLGIFKDRRLLIHQAIPENYKNKPAGQISEVQADHLILATGARERYLPFKGWTLPGVMSLGAAQILMKSHGVLPAFRTAIAGTSPLMMVLASEILSHHGSVAAILDENPFRKKLRFLPLVQHHWPKLFEGAFYTLQMMVKKIPAIHHARIVEVRGKHRFESVIMARTTPQGHVIKGTETEYRADALAIGYGFVPNIELAVQAGCGIEYQAAKGGWVVAADKNFESSVNAVYAVGEINGIAGAKKSYVQGKLAAFSILGKLGKMNFKKQDVSLSKQIQRLRNLNRQQTGYSAFFNHLCRPPLTAYQEIPDDTLICRCENITMKTIKDAITLGFTTSGGLKKATRCGMGRCQGRVCGTIVADIVTALTNKPAEDIGPSLSRAPVKNVTIRSFIDPAIEKDIQ